jgi:predicted SAM-dependent methyltransferase
LHLGCGADVVPGWVNIDKSPSILLSRAPRLRKALGRVGILTPAQARGFPPGAVRADVSKRIPAADASAEFAYSSHMIEHMSRWQALSFFRECRRVLRPGGVLRLATPDLEEMIRDYSHNRSPLLAEQPTRADAFCAEYGAYSDPPSIVRRFVKKWLGGESHQWLYDAESLTFLLRESGFAEVTRCSYRKGTVPDLDLVENRERGLFVEAH